MICAHCQHYDLRTSPAHTKVGLARCKKKPSYVFIPIKTSKICEKFIKVDDETRIKREKYIK